MVNKHRLSKAKISGLHKATASGRSNRPGKGWGSRLLGSQATVRDRVPLLQHCCFFPQGVWATGDRSGPTPPGEQFLT